MLKKMKTETLKEVYNMLEKLIDEIMVAFVAACITLALLNMATNFTTWVSLAGGITFGIMFTFGFMMITTAMMMMVDTEIKDRRTDD